MKTCRQCGVPIGEEEVFCSQCGAKQGAGGMMQGSEGRRQRSEDRCQESGVSGERSEVSRQVSGNVLEQGTPGSPFFTRDLPLQILWNTARKFVEEVTLSFNLRLTPEFDLKNLEFLITSDSENVGQLTKRIAACPGGTEKRIDIPFRAPTGSAGEIPFDVFLRFEQDGKPQILCAAQAHHIYKAEQIPQAVHYHSETHVKGGDGHANDQHVSVIGGDMPDLSKREKKALWEEINAQENWEPLDLQETGSFPPELPRKAQERLKENTESTLRNGESSDREKTRKDRERKIIRLAGGAAAILILLLYLLDYGVRESAPVQVNVVQQSGEGMHTAVIETAAKTQPAKTSEEVPVPPEKKAGAEPVVTTEGVLHVEFELAGGRTEFREGESLQYRIRSNRDCYVALLCRQSDETTVVLFPNRWHPESFIKGGLDVLIPAEDSGFQIIVSPPFGVDTVELIACTGRNEFHRMLGDGAVLATRSSPFSVFPSEQLGGVLTRGMQVLPKGAVAPVWARSEMVVYTQKLSE